ncbi:MAG: M23 family metallopeptidase [Myxococcota bacterium]
MPFKPSIQEGLRILSDMDPEQRNRARQILGGALIVLGLLLGFAVGQQMGSGTSADAADQLAADRVQGNSELSVTDDRNGDSDGEYALSTKTIRSMSGADSAMDAEEFDARLAKRLSEYGALSSVSAGPVMDGDISANAANDADGLGIARVATAAYADSLGSESMGYGDSVAPAALHVLDADDHTDHADHADHTVEGGVEEFIVASVATLPDYAGGRASGMAGGAGAFKAPTDSLTIVTRGEIGKGESLATALKGQGISPGTVHLIATEMRKVFDFRRSRPGDKYRLAQEPDGRVLDFRYSQSPEESFYLAWEGTRYVVKKETAELRPQVAKIAGIVDSSFYGAVLALGEQSALASEFARILAWDIDFSRNVHPGDEFAILYERLYRRNADGEEVYVRPGRVLAGRYAGKAGDHTIVLFEDHLGHAAYFRPDGSSVERAFLAAPLEFSRISSRFTGSRRHPILKITRPHPGIDYAAPHGTPIWAVSDGTVEYRARAGGSGNLIRIRHVGGYTSHYAHLSKFAKNLKVGDKVTQKQIIGYVGSTGLSTGPHVCFRVKKDGRYVDPMKISSPAGEPVAKAKIEQFAAVRDELLADLGPGAVSVADEAL